MILLLSIIAVHLLLFSLTLVPALLIGSIDTINKRICELDGELRSYVRLVVESGGGGARGRGGRGLVNDGDDDRDMAATSTTTETGQADDLTDIVAHSDKAREQFKIKRWLI